VSGNLYTYVLYRVTELVESGQDLAVLRDRQNGPSMNKMALSILDTQGAYTLEYVPTTNDAEARRETF
jgi:hypothetical protein